MYLHVIKNYKNILLYNLIKYFYNYNRFKLNKNILSSSLLNGLILLL